MRKSNQLKLQDTCKMNPNANTTITNDNITTAVVQKKIIHRALMGEPIDNYRDELASDFDANDKKWDNLTYRDNTLNSMAQRIERFVDYENNTEWRRNKKFRSELNGGEPIVVDYFGEQIEVLPDYIIEHEDEIFDCKVKTGRPDVSNSKDIMTQESYALGLAGEQLYPGKKVYLQYLYLGDPSASTEKDSLRKLTDTEYIIHYDDTSKKYNKIHEAIFDSKLKEQLVAQHNELEEKSKEGCSPEKCAGCSNYNICNYEEPPIAKPVEDVIHRDWEQIEQRLSFDQRSVINFENGISRVNAGPGSGKTLVTSLRVSNLIEKGYDPNKICLLTFTKAGAGEMTARSVDYSAFKGLPLDPDTFTSTTFNAFCQEIINNNYEELGYSRKPRVIPDEVKRGIINRIIDQFPHITGWNYGANASTKIWNYSTTKTAFAAAERDFALIKKEKYTRDTFDQRYANAHEYTSADLDILFLMYEEYQRQLKDRALLEYDDQLGEVERLLKIHPTLFEEMGFEHIIVDEFQDTDFPQIELLQKMIDTTKFKSLMCVGDDSQSIFAFRHTSPEYMINFENYFGNSQSFNLVENHRSPKAVIKYANQINSMAKLKVDKELKPTKDGDEPDVYGFYTKNQEYEWIAKDIKKRYEAGERDIAIIMSNRFELSAMADKLTALKIPSAYKAPVMLSQNSRIRALCTFYDSFMGKSTQGLLDYRNVIEKGNLKNKTTHELNEIVENFKGDLLQCEKTKDAFMEFAKALDLSESDECYQDFLTKVDECRDIDELKEFISDFKTYGQDSTYTKTGDYDGVTLTTIHSSKGLEWDTTYLCIDQLYNKKYHDRPTYYEQNGEMDEQIRKWFVGATRAKEDLIVTGTYICDEDKKNHVNYFNRFLKDTYEMLGKVWDYSFAEGERVKAQENAEKVKDILNKDGIPVTEEGKQRKISANVAKAVANASKVLVCGKQEEKETDDKSKSPIVDESKELMDDIELG